MLYLLGLILICALGFCVVRTFVKNKIDFCLQILLSFVLGLGIIGTIGFYIHLLLNQFNHVLPILCVLIGITYGTWYLKNMPKIISKSQSQLPLWSKNHTCGIITLSFLTIPLCISANFDPIGGWDAWSCWNLKAKFIFLGQDHWKDMFDPTLWRSNTHYPLLWPLINVWFFDLIGQFNQHIPLFNSLLIAFLTAGILIFGILALTGNIWAGILAAIFSTAIPIETTLFTSQYSDSLLGLFLLSCFVSYLLAEKYALEELKILSFIFLGLMSFTKNEGLVLSLISTSLLFWQGRHQSKQLKNQAISFVISCIPTIIFLLWMAPKNEAFTNGLISNIKPITWQRLEIIAVYPWLDFINSQWNGLWLFFAAGIILAGKKLWQSTLKTIGLSLILYMGVVTAYYAINTFFEISWWLSTTYTRIVFALIPTLTLWLSIALRDV